VSDGQDGKHPVARTVARLGGRGHPVALETEAPDLVFAARAAKGANTQRDIAPFE